MRKKFICFAKGKEQFNYKGESLGIGHDRSIYYSESVGKHRLYRNSYPIPDPSTLKPLIYSNEEEAKRVCDQTNSHYNDDFVVIEI